jgi:membrane-bound metal-dependent hydrolase YbcI (DUF457 family)
MDIVTHMLTGAVLAGPILPKAPLTGACLLVGSVLPDLDVFSRCFGKQAFLRWHQTYTHGLPAIAAAGVAAWLLMPGWLEEPWAPVALAVGMLLHVGLDLSNTYGTAVLSPLSSRRYCTGWVFFIDVVVLLASIGAVILQHLPRHAAVPQQQGIAVAYGLVLVTYWAAKIGLYSRAMRYSPSRTVSLIPSALVPWRYFGCARSDNRVRTFRLNALTGVMDQDRENQILDARYGPWLVGMPEFQIMRELSPVYHVIDAFPHGDEICLTCRDLRVRNFGGRFGELMVVVDSNGQILRRRFNV